MRENADGHGLPSFTKKKSDRENRTTVVAVLMDWPLGEHTATVLASAGGDASLYTTSTFGLLGGIGHASVRKGLPPISLAAHSTFP